VFIIVAKVPLISFSKINNRESAITPQVQAMKIKFKELKTLNNSVIETIATEKSKVVVKTNSLLFVINFDFKSTNRNKKNTK